ncbi:MAG: hypothetical protein AAFO58_09750, partial [Pseudomonadota bacterium]
YMGVHRPRFYKHKPIPDPGTVRWYNGSGHDVGSRYYEKGWRSNPETVGYALAQVNHYAIKSREDFLLKRLRGTANSKNKDRINPSYWRKYDLNATHDATIPSAGVRDEMQRLLADPDLAVLYRASLDSARRTLADQKTDPVWAKFVEDGSFPEGAVDKPKKQPKRKAAPPPPPPPAAKIAKSEAAE